MPFLTVIATLVLAGPKPVVLTLKPTVNFDTPDMLAVAASPKGDLVAASFDDNSVRIIDAANHKTYESFKQHQQPVYAIAWSPDGKYIASGDESAYVYVWKVGSGAIVDKFRKHIRGIIGLSFNASGNLLLSDGRDDMVEIYNLKAKKPIQSILGHGQNLYGAKFDPTRALIGTADLVSGGIEYRMDGTIYKHLDGHGGQGALDLAFNPAGTEAVTAGRDNTAIVWDVNTGKKIGTYKGHTDEVIHCAYSPNGQVVATSSIDRTVKLWNPKTLETLATISDESSIGAPICFTADGKYLVSSSVYDHLQVTPIVPAQASSPAPKARAKYRRRVYRRRR